jgi:hypothetical protein
MLRHVAILIRLRWKLMMGSFAGKAGRQAAAALGFLLVLIMAALFASSSYLLVRGRDPAAAEAARPVLLRIVFLGTFVMQLMTSVISLSVSDFFDTSRLMHLPVRARSIFFAMLLSSVLSPSTLLFGAPALGAIAALPGPTAAHVFHAGVVVALLLFGQAISLFCGYLLLGALSRRRLRDAATILGSVVGLAFYVSMRLFRPEALVGQWVTSKPVWTALSFSPSSLFADLIQPGAAFVAEGAALAGTIVEIVGASLALGGSFVLGAWAFGRFYRRAGEASEVAGPASKVPIRSHFLPAEIGAVARQTLSVIWREPQLKAMLFQQMVFLAVPFIVLPREGGLSGGAMWSVPFFVVFSHGWLALSFLGVDGSGLKLLLQSPAPRGRILLGRGLALGWLFAIIDVAAMGLLFLVTVVWSGRGQEVPRFLELTVACLVADWFLVAAGILISVLVPSPLVRRGKHVRMRQEGCATSAGKVLLRLPVMALAVLAGLVTALPVIFPVGRIWYFACIPAGLAVTAATAAIAIAIGSRRLVSAEEKIVAALADAGD